MYLVRIWYEYPYDLDHPASRLVAESWYGQLEQAMQWIDREQDRLNNYGRWSRMHPHIQIFKLSCREEDKEMLERELVLHALK